MPDSRENGFTRVTYVDGDLLFLPRSAYEGLVARLTGPDYAAQEGLDPDKVRAFQFWEGAEIDGLDVVVRLSEVREVLDVTAEVRAKWQASEAEEAQRRLTGGGD